MFIRFTKIHNVCKEERFIGGKRFFDHSTGIPGDKRSAWTWGQTGIVYTCGVRRCPQNMCFRDALPRLEKALPYERNIPFSS